MSFTISTRLPGARVLITGATGTVGREVCRLLHGTGNEVLGATRRPMKAERIEVPVTRWVSFDYEDPSSFAPALEGVERLFLIARPGDDDPATAAKSLLRAARAAGVRRVVNLTALGAERRDDVRLRQVERLVEESGLTYTHLRPNWFMQVFSTGPLQANIRTAGRLAIPAGDARISFVDARDVAAVAAQGLVEKGHEHRAYELTGSEALTHSAVATLIASAARRPVEYLAIDESEARAAILAAGLGPDRTERLIQFYRLVREGHSAPVTGDIESVLGRPPIPFAHFAREHAAVWRRPQSHDSTPL